VVFDRRSIDGLALILRLLVRSLGRGLRACVTLEWRPLTVALPVAAAAAAATAPAAMRAFAGLAFAELSAVLRRLSLS
jgi:hypothetical protein